MNNPNIQLVPQSKQEEILTSLRKQLATSQAACEQMFDMIERNQIINVSIPQWMQFVTFALTNPKPTVYCHILFNDLQSMQQHIEWLNQVWTVNEFIFTINLRKINNSELMVSFEINLPTFAIQVRHNFEFKMTDINTIEQPQTSIENVLLTMKGLAQ